MIWIEALEESGLSNKVLKRVMTAKPPERKEAKKEKGAKRKDRGDARAPASDPVSTIYSLEKLPSDPTDWDIRCYLETMIRAEMLEGQMRCAQYFNKWMAVDLAYASIPIHPTTLPLMQVAMGRIDLETCMTQLAGISEEWRNKLFERDANGKIAKVNVPKLIEVSHNLVHSLVTRRVAALATEIYQQYPVLKYDPYSNTPTGRLVGDVMTQLAEQMAGAYNYRHDYEESIRQASLYTTSIKFKARAWHREYQRLPVRRPKTGADRAGRQTGRKFERQIVREGVVFAIPHPSRTYYDISKPLSKLNSDLGPEWIGYWDVVPIGTILDDPAYWNTDAIALDAEMFQLFAQNPAYFAQYYDRINYPGAARTPAAAMALSNDRVAQIGKWAQTYRKSSTVLTEHFKKIIPKRCGLGSYEDPVWIRFVMAANTTCVFAEIVGSPPASVNSYNATDGLLMSPTFGSQAMQWQQQLTNQLEELRRVQAQGLIRIWALNKHGMSKEEVETVENALKNPDFEGLKDIVITYDAEIFAQRGQDINTITQKITQIRVETATKVGEIFQNMMNTIAMAERLLFFSPQELGQVAQRTTSAFEQKAIRDTTLGIRDFHLTGVKQQMDADKRIIHHSYMAFGSDDLEVPVAERYERKVIEAAGFEVVDDGTGEPPDGLYTVRGKKLGLFYNYTYTTRNTDDTPPDAARAQGIAQVYDVLTKDPVLAENTNVEQRMELANSLFEHIAPGIFKLRVPEGVDPKQTQAGMAQKLEQQFQQVMPQIGAAIQELKQAQQQQQQQIAMQDAGLKELAGSLTRLTSLLERQISSPVRREPPTQRGRVSPTTAPGAGAPPLRGVTRPRGVPIIGPQPATT